METIKIPEVAKTLAMKNAYIQKRFQESPQSLRILLHCNITYLKVIGSIFHENCEFTFVKWINA